MRDPSFISHPTSSSTTACPQPNTAKLLPSSQTASPLTATTIISVEDHHGFQIELPPVPTSPELCTMAVLLTLTPTSLTLAVPPSSEPDAPRPTARHHQHHRHPPSQRHWAKNLPSPPSSTPSLPTLSSPNYRVQSLHNSSQQARYMESRLSPMESTNAFGTCKPPTPSALTDFSPSTTLPAIEVSIHSSREKSPSN